MEALVVARAEARSLRRGAPAWLLAVCAVGVGIAAFLHLSIRHYLAQDPNSVPPRLLAHGLGTVVLGILLVGMALIGSAAQARHQREGIADALHCRPCSNLALVFGRFLALALLGWSVVLLYCAATGIAAWIEAYRSGGAAVQAFEPWSLATFALVNAPTALAFWCALTIALAAAVGRWLAALLALALLGVQGWALHHAPVGMLALVSTLGDAAAIASDIAPRGLAPPAWAHRVALLVIAGGLLCVAAAAYPRPEAMGRRRRLLTGAALVAGGLACGVALAEQVRADWRERGQWAAVHKNLRNEPRAELKRIAGRVLIAPGTLALAVDLHLVRSSAEPADKMVLSLNPGLRVRQVQLDAQEVAYRHEHGLLTVRLAADSARSPARVLTVRADGVPTERFAHLDAVVHARERSLAESRLHVLGTEASIFEAGYVALTPSTRWLPMPGANYPADGTASPDAGRFHLDLEIGVPPGWRAAGPGRAEPLGDERKAAASEALPRSTDSAWFRVHTRAPVSDAAIFAAPFERRSARIGAVEFAVFLHPRHMAPFDAHDADALADLNESVALGLRIAEGAGLAYPHEVFQLVEVPGRLRTYGSVHTRANTAFPGVALLREHAFTTIKKWDWNEDGRLGELRRYLDRDLLGGNPLNGVHEHLFGLQAQAQGNYGFRLLMEEVGKHAVAGWFGGSVQGFLGHVLAFPERSPALGAIIADTTPVRSAALHGRAAAWEWAEDAPLADADAASNPRSLPTFARKARALGRQFTAEIGVGATLPMLAELRERVVFRPEDVHTAARRQGAAANIANYLRAKQLPGFLFSHPAAFRLPDAENGSPRYQITLRVRNAEPADGLVQLRYHADTHLPTFPFFGKPTPVPGCATVALGMLAADPPTGISVNPFYALNRAHVFLRVPDFDTRKPVPAEPFVGAKPIDWQGEPDAGVVVDDLEARFDENAGAARYVVDALARRWRALTGPSEFQDGGIPVLLHGLPKGRWYRAATPWAWGRYRHTLAWTPAGDGRRRAVFAATLAGGRWSLDYHLPGRTFSGAFTPRDGLAQGGLGTLAIVVRDSESSRNVPFDTRSATSGWNRIGEFDLRSGTVQVHITNHTQGARVIADAIRWQPADADTLAAFKALGARRNASRVGGEDSANLASQTKGEARCPEHG